MHEQAARRVLRSAIAPAPRCWRVALLRWCKATVVDVSLLSASMWLLQRGITQATIDGIETLPGPKRDTVTNPLVNTYRTKDGRFVALCMLQGQHYWAGYCAAAGRPDPATAPRPMSARTAIPS